MEQNFAKKWQEARKRQYDLAPVEIGVFKENFPLNLDLGPKAAQIVIENSLWAGANFSGADLRYSQFVDCDMNHVDMSGADLTHAFFLRCDLRFADFTGAKGLSWDSFEDCLWAEGINFPDNMKYDRNDRNVTKNSFKECPNG